MKKQFLSLILISIVIMGCNTVKKALTTTISQGTVIEQNYKEEISFDYYNKFIFVSLKIDKKEYQFIYDTGNVLTAIDDDIAKELGAYYKDFSANLTDANDGSRNTQLISLKKIRLGKIQFENIGAQITDLSAISESLGCRPIHGIIGSNFIRKAKWQIDYQNKKIKFSDQLDTLLSNTNSIDAIGLNPNHLRFQISLNDIASNYLLDTGYNGFIKSNFVIFEKLKVQKNFNFLESENLSFSAFSKNIDTTYYSSIKKIALDDINLENQIVNFKPSENEIVGSLIGNRFLENYVLTLDWNERKIYLNPVKAIKKDFYKKFPVAFSPNYSTNSIEITRVLRNEANIELKLGTKVIKINEIDVSNFNKSELCEFWKKYERPFFDNFDELSIEISDMGVPKKVNLVKREFLKE